MRMNSLARAGNSSLSERFAWWKVKWHLNTEVYLNLSWHWLT